MLLPILLWKVEAHLRLVVTTLTNGCTTFIFVRLFKTHGHGHGLDVGMMSSGVSANGSRMQLVALILRHVDR